MSFLPPDQIHELMRFAFFADTEARSDLANGFTKDENDYTSNFTSALRRNINSYSQTGLSATSFLLSHIEEREFGGDATIILSRGNESKVAILEAKWPRFSSAGHQWDYNQTATGLSHFSDQLERQKRWSGTCAIFEMFYCEYPFGEQPAFLDKRGSSCVWHEDAEKFRAHRTNPSSIWSQGELQNLIENSGTNVPAVMFQFGECSKGQVIRMAQPEAIGREFGLPPRILAIAAALEREPRETRE